MFTFGWIQFVTVTIYHLQVPLHPKGVPLERSRGAYERGVRARPNLHLLVLPVVVPLTRTRRVLLVMRMRLVPRVLHILLLRRRRLHIRRLRVVRRVLHLLLLQIRLWILRLLWLLILQMIPLLLVLPHHIVVLHALCIGPTRSFVPLRVPRRRRRVGQGRGVQKRLVETVGSICACVLSRGANAQPARHP